MASTLHVATHSGYYRFERRADGGWAETARGLTFWSLSCLALDAGRLYVGTSHSGLFVSDDGGASWQRPNPNVPHLGTASLLAEGGQLLVGTVPATLFRRRDGGWEELDTLRLATDNSCFPPNPELGARTRFLASDPFASGVLYAGIEVGGMLVSQDGGATWQPANDGLTDPDVHEVRASRHTAGLAYAACGEEGLFRGEERGAHWQLVNPPGARTYGTSVVEDAGGCVYASVTRGRPNTWIRAEGADAAIVRSEDAGRSWQLVAEGLRGGVLDMAAPPDDAEVYAGTSDGDLLEVSPGGVRALASHLPCITALAAA
jgi:photosystem II stability/assembly factor-like uncharacterized protein